MNKCLISIIFFLIINNLYVFGQIKIGTFYFDGWSKLQWDNYKIKNYDKGPYNNYLLNDFSDRKPMYGWITSTKENVEKQIDDAHYINLDFFIFDTYYCKDIGYSSCFSNNALDIYIKSKNINKVPFLSMITNDSFDIGPKEWDETKSFLFYLFSNPSYYKINGRPIIIIYKGDKIINAFGSIKKFDSILNKFKKEARTRGYKKPIIGIMNIAIENLEKLKNIDFITTYNDPTAAKRFNNYDPSIKEYEFSTLQEGEKINWDLYLPYIKKKKFFIPTVTSGWDPRPWNGKDENGKWNTELWYKKATKSEFYHSINNADKFNKKNSSINMNNRIILINAWNEYGEGSYISKMENGEFLGEVIKIIKENQKK